MIQRIISHTSQPRFLIGLLIVQIAVFAGIAWNLSEIARVSGGTGILDFEFGYSVETVRTMFASYGDAGFKAYRNIQLLDLINPIIYSTLLASALSALLQKRTTKWPIYIPYAAGALDYLENGFLFMFTSTHPDVSAKWVSVASTLSISKRVALLLTAAALVYAVTRRFIDAR